MFSRLETGRYWVSSPALAAYMAKPTFGAVFTVPVVPIEFNADYWIVTHRLAGGIVGVDTDGLLLGGLQGHDSEMWSREWQLEHQPSVLLAIPLKH